MTTAGDDDDDLVDIVPAAVARVLEPRNTAPPRVPSAHSFARLLRRRVVVVAEGITYRGVLCGADETDLYLRGELRWLVLPLEKVRSVDRDHERNDDDPDDDDDEDVHGERDVDGRSADAERVAGARRSSE